MNETLAMLRNEQRRPSGTAIEVKWEGKRRPPEMAKYLAIGQRPSPNLVGAPSPALLFPLPAESSEIRE